MSLLTAVLVDDEKKSLDTLDYMLREYCPQVSVLQKFSSSVEALKKIPDLNPDVIFLDIQMPQINGLELLKMLGDSARNVIFVTAYNEYVLHALRLSAIDYLTKPINHKELAAALERVKTEADLQPEQLEATFLNYAKRNEESLDKRFGVKSGNAVKFITLKEICYCTSEGNMTMLHLTDNTRILCSENMKSLNKKLPSSSFYRPHRLFLINLYQIKEYNRAEGGYVIMDCDDEKRVNISRGHSADFAEIMDRMQRTGRPF